MRGGPVYGPGPGGGGTRGRHGSAPVPRRMGSIDTGAASATGGYNASTTTSPWTLGATEWCGTRATTHQRSAPRWESVPPPPFDRRARGLEEGAVRAGPEP